MGNCLIRFEPVQITRPNEWLSYFTKGAWHENIHQGINLYLDSKFDTFNISHNLTLGYSSSSTKNSNGGGRQTYFLPNNMTLSEFTNLTEPNWSEWGSILDNPVTPNTKIQFDNILIGDDIVFNESWSVLVGLNYSTAINDNLRTSIKYDASKLIPTLSLIFKPFESLTTYMTYIESLEAGTIVGDTYQNAREILDPYISKQFEVGTKYSVNDNILITGSLFQIEKASSYVIPATRMDTLPVLTQDGKQTHQGLELSLTGKVTDHLTLLAGGTLMDLSIDKATNKNLEGKKPIDVAGVMAKIYVEYQIPTIEGLYLTGGTYYTGKKYANNVNTDILPAYTLFDAGIRYATNLGKYPTTFNLNATNLTDEVYWSYGAMVGDPRTVAFSVKTQF